MQLSRAVANGRSVHAIPAQNTQDSESLRLIGVTLTVGRDQEIFGEGEPADNVYKVVRGAVRCFRVLSDGRRQICGFYLPGDIFGLEPGDDHRATAEAVTESVLVAARRSSLNEEKSESGLRKLWALAMGELQRGQDHVLTLGRRTAQERVAKFLVDMAERLGGGEDLDLPMSRQDIADFLGLTIETVSRTMTQMQVGGHIRLNGCRHVHLCRPRALEELCA